MNDKYTPEVLAKVCPKCFAAKGGKCLQPKRDGNDYREEPHSERVGA